jgi:putative membrane protein
MMYGYPYGGMLIAIGIIWIIQLIIGYLVYRDAKSRKINALLRFILVILPMIGWLFLVIYVILRQNEHPEITTGRSALQILDKRYTKGEICSEEYQRMKVDLKRQGESQ